MRAKQKAEEWMLSGLLFRAVLFDWVAGGVDVLDGGEVEFF
jgi:hypothetical protein